MKNHCIKTWTVLGVLTAVLTASLQAQSNLLLSLKIQSGTGLPQVSWPTVGGKTYYLGVANKLTNTFSRINTYTETNVPIGMPGTNTYSDPLSVHSSTSPRFYQVQRQSTPNPSQADISVVDEMPNNPTNPSAIPLLINWSQQASNYDAFMFNAAASGSWQPTMWWDNQDANIINQTDFGLPSYVGENIYPYPMSGEEGDHEAITCMSAVVGGALVGINQLSKVTPASTPANFAQMCEQYYVNYPGNSQQAFLNYESTGSGGDWWYDLTPNELAFMLYSIYGTNIDATNAITQTPITVYGTNTSMESMVTNTANTWYNVEVALGGGNSSIPDFNWTAVDLLNYGVNYEGWTEPDAAGGIACMEYWAYTEWGTPEYLQGAEWGMQFLQNQSSSVYYENQMPWGAYIAARMNAELGTSYNVGNFVNWCFSGSQVRGGWGASIGQWGSEDCWGLIGYNNAGYAMDTFNQAAALVPLVRYDYHYATEIGKWMLNLCHAARLYYPNYISCSYQSSCGDFPADTNYTVAYEELQNVNGSYAPYATGAGESDGCPTDLGVYGSSWVGFLGAIVRPTNTNSVLQLNCLATDFYHASGAYPTYLYYNPYSSAVAINITVTNTCDLYDCVSKTMLGYGVSGTPSFTVPSNGSVLLVVLPHGGSWSYNGSQALYNNVIVDYMYNE